MTIIKSIFLGLLILFSACKREQSTAKQDPTSPTQKTTESGDKKELTTRTLDPRANALANPKMAYQERITNNSYKSLDNKFEFNIPNLWLSEQKISKGYTYFYGPDYSQSNNPYPKISIIEQRGSISYNPKTSESIEQPVKLEKFVESYQKSSPKKFQNTKIIQEKKVKMGERELHHQSYSGIAPGTNLEIYTSTYFVPHENIVYLIILNCLLQDKEKYESIFDKGVAELKLK